jgi:hypothetical protein
MPVCLAVAGALVASLPTQAFSLVWSHSVEKTEWREEWSVEGDRLRLAEAAVRGSGAGMEPPADAAFVDREWRYQPGVPPLHRLALKNSEFGGPYRLCWSGGCRPLASLLPSGAVGAVELYACQDVRR